MAECCVILDSFAVFFVGWDGKEMRNPNFGGAAEKSDHRA